MNEDLDVVQIFVAGVMSIFAMIILAFFLVIIFSDPIKFVVFIGSVVLFIATAFGAGLLVKYFFPTLFD